MNFKKLEELSFEISRKVDAAISRITGYANAAAERDLNRREQHCFMVSAPAYKDCSLWAYERQDIVDFVSHRGIQFGGPVQITCLTDGKGTTLHEL